MFENRVLRRTYGSKRKTATGDGRKILNEQLHNFQRSIIIIRIVK